MIIQRKMRRIKILRRAMLPTSRNELRSFTLLELIISVAIIVIMSGAIVAMTGSFSHRRQLEADAFKLAEDLRTTQESARTQQTGYYGLRFHSDLGGQGRQGWKIVRYCQIDANSNCIGEVSPPITGATTFRVIKSSEVTDNNGNGPESLENTFFSERVVIAAASEFQVTPATLPKRDSIVFTPEGSATTDGQIINLLVDTNADGIIGIILTLFGNTITIQIIPLTGHVQIQ